MRSRTPRLDWIEKVLGDSVEGRRERGGPPVLRLVSGAASPAGQGAVKPPAAVPAIRDRLPCGPPHPRPKDGR